MKYIYRVCIIILLFLAGIIGFSNAAHAQSADFTITCSENFCDFVASDTTLDSYEWQFEGDQGDHWSVSSGSLTSDSVAIEFDDCSSPDGDGKYDATLTVNGSDSQTKETDEITNCGGSDNLGLEAVINDVAELPACSNELSISGSQSSPGEYSEITCKWDYDGDGEYEDSQTVQADSLENCATTYEVPAPDANREVTLTVEANGESDSTSRTFTDDNFPQLRATFSWSKIDSETLEFDASDSCSPWGEILSYWWDWNGDGDTDDDVDEKAISRPVKEKDISAIPSSGQTAAAILAAEMGDTLEVGLKVFDSNDNFSAVSVQTVDTTDESGDGSDDDSTSDGDDSDDDSGTSAELGGDITSAQGGLVPCSGVAGSDGAEECTFQDLIILVQNVIDFLIAIATVIAMLMFAYAGFLYLVYGSNPGQRKKANSIFQDVIFGFALMLLAWLIINTILAALGVPESYELLG